MCNMSTTSNMLELTPLDLIMPEYYTRLALSFRTSDLAESLLPQLQASLHSTCQSIPWLRGKVYATSGSKAQKPELQVRWEEDESPKLVDLGSLTGSYSEAAAAGMPLKIIPNDRWPISVRIDDGLRNAGAPVFAGGLLSFEDSEGVILCVCIHHNVVDAGGFAEVLRTWTLILTGSPATFIDPSDRAGLLLAALRPHVDSASDIPLKTLLQSHPEYTSTSPQIGADIGSCTSTILTVSIPKVNRLKEELAAFTNTALTVNTIICAVLWWGITRTRRRRNPTLFPPDCTSRLGMAVNGRARIGPGFSREDNPYFGNVNLYSLAEMSMDRLSNTESTSAESLAQICDVIAASNSPSKINAHHIAEVCSLVSRSDKYPALFPGWTVFGGLDLAITSWANLGIYDMSFGDALGRPEFVRIPYAEVDSLAIVLPRKRAGGESASEDVIEVVVMLRRDDLESLQQDELWKKLAF